MKNYDNTVAACDIKFKSGKGAVLTDTRGKEYIDLLAGVAVNLLGYSDSGLLAAAEKQMKKYIHLSRIFEDENRKKLAAGLIANSFGNNVYFVNSGAEANEVAVKMARKWGILHKKGAYEIITMYNSFHGRTIAALSATGQKKFHKYLKPKSPGFKYAKYNDISDLKKKISAKTAAVMIEPVQAEGGVNIPSKAYMKQLESVCRKNKVLLIVDEVQTGLGRTGYLFAYQEFGIVPDIMTLGKGLGGGFPLSAVVASEKAGKIFCIGDHGTTMGGNPVACAAGNYLMGKINKKSFLAGVKSRSSYLAEKLKNVSSPLIKEVRGKGFIVGIEFKKNIGPAVTAQALKRGLILNCPKPNIIRIVPPLVIEKKDIDRAAEIFEKVMKTIQDRHI